jgi:hypothetical protein
MLRVANAFETETQTQGDAALELSIELRSALEGMSETRAKPRARRALQEATSIRNELFAEFGESFDKQEIVEELKALADQLGNMGAWPPDIGMTTGAFKKRCEDFRAAAVGEALEVLAKTGQEDAEAGGPSILSAMGRLDVTPLILAAEVAQVGRTVVLAAEKQASSLEEQFKGVDPREQAAEILKALQTVLSKLESFSAEGELS